MRYRLRQTEAGVRALGRVTGGAQGAHPAPDGGGGSRAVGDGGITRVSQVTGLSRSTITRGLQDLADPTRLPPAGRLRQPGGGRKPVTAHDPTLLPALLRLVNPATRGDPESALQ